VIFEHRLKFLLTVAMLLAATALAAGATTVPVTLPTQPGGSIPFAPFLGIGILVFVLALLAACLLLVGLGLAVGMAICAAVGALAMAGIISTSVVTGFLRRSPASGLRVFFLQAGSLAGVPCGMAAMWLVSWLKQNNWSLDSILMIGGIGGLIDGAAVALLFNHAWGLLAAWLLKQLNKL